MIMANFSSIIKELITTRELPQWPKMAEDNNFPFFFFVCLFPIKLRKTGKQTNKNLSLYEEILKQQENELTKT